MITRSHTSSHDTSYTGKHDHMSHDPSYVHIKHQPSHTDNIPPQPLLLPLWIPCCKANLSCFEHMWDNSKPLVPVVPTVDSYCPGIPLGLLPLSILFLLAESPLSTLCQGILTWCSYMAFLHGISYMAFLTRHSTRHHSHRVLSVEDGKFCFPTPVLVVAHGACNLDCCFHPPTCTHPPAYPPAQNELPMKK